MSGYALTEPQIQELLGRIDLPVVNEPPDRRGKTAMVLILLEAIRLAAENIRAGGP